MSPATVLVRSLTALPLAFVLVTAVIQSHRQAPSCCTTAQAAPVSRSFDCRDHGRRTRLILAHVPADLPVHLRSTPAACLARMLEARSRAIEARSRALARDLAAQAAAEQTRWHSTPPG